MCKRMGVGPRWGLQYFGVLKEWFILVGMQEGRGPWVVPPALCPSASWDREHLL